METITNAPTVAGIRKETVKSEVTLSRVYVNEFQKKGTKTAEVRQKIVNKSFYPSAKTETELQSGLFSTEDFGFKSKEYESTEERVAWVLVPENASEASVIANIAKQAKANSCVYRVLSNAPILDDNQKYAVNQGLRTFDFFADKQAVRYPENDTTIADGSAGKLILDKSNNVQYRRTFYWSSAHEDVDSRDGKSVYLTPEMDAELHGASKMEGQII